jgi:hypothetical protein
MKMVKKCLIAIALLGFLTTTVQAGDDAQDIWKFDDHWPWVYLELEVCQIEVLMDIGHYVQIKDCHKVKPIILKQITCPDGKKFPCYKGCTEFQLRANFEVKVGTKLYKLSDVIKDNKWEGSILLTDGVTDGSIVPGDGDYHKRLVCVEAWEAQIWKAGPGDKVLVGEVAITVKPNA